MKIRMLLIISIAVLGCIILSGCLTSKQNTDKAIPYTIAQRYFVRNDVVGLPPTVITTAEEFEKNFGMATAMGPDGKPTEIDFNKSFVICVTIPPTDIATSLSLISLCKVKPDQLVLQYKIKQGEKLSYTTQPLILLVVDKKYEMPVKLEDKED